MSKCNELRVNISSADEEEDNQILAEGTTLTISLVQDDITCAIKMNEASSKPERVAITDTAGNVALKRTTLQFIQLGRSSVRSCLSLTVKGVLVVNGQR